MLSVQFTTIIFLELLNSIQRIFYDLLTETLKDLYTVIKMQLICYLEIPMSVYINPNLFNVKDFFKVI